jgi:hypothetical protein
MYYDVPSEHSYTSPPYTYRQVKKWPGRPGYIYVIHSLMKFISLEVNLENE